MKKLSFVHHSPAFSMMSAYANLHNVGIRNSKLQTRQKRSGKLQDVFFYFSDSTRPGDISLSCFECEKDKLVIIKGKKISQKYSE